MKKSILLIVLVIIGRLNINLRDYYFYKIFGFCKCFFSQFQLLIQSQFVITWSQSFALIILKKEFICKIVLGQEKTTQKFKLLTKARLNKIKGISGLKLTWKIKLT